MISTQPTNSAPTRRRQPVRLAAAANSPLVGGEHHDAIGALATLIADLLDTATTTGTVSSPATPLAAVPGDGIVEALRRSGGPGTIDRATRRSRVA